MAISKKEQKFLRTALRLNYLDPTEVADIHETYVKNNSNIAQWCIDRELLSSWQVNQILDIIIKKRKTEKETNQKIKKTAKKEEKATPRKELMRSNIVGQKWGDFEIEEKIGKGGMGVVYKVKSRDQKHIIALKILIAGAMAKTSHSRRFIREARAVARLDHPSIIPIYEVGENEGAPFFTMRYVSGGTYEQKLRENSLTIKELMHILGQIAEVLQHAHDNMVIHRDIKPANILLDNDNHPYLVDFGLAKLLDVATSLTRTGQALGTPYYMPPEQAQGDKNQIGPTCDVYSLGVVIYRTITGHFPFKAKTSAELCRKIIQGNPPPPSSYNPEIPPSLEAICLKAIEKSPRFRYARASDLAQDLFDFCQDKPVMGCRHSSLQKIQKQFLYHPTRIVVVFLTLLCLVLFVFRPTTPKIIEKQTPASYDVAMEEFQKQNYSRSLEEIAKILQSQPNHKPSIILQAKIYQITKNEEQLRMSWAHLSEFSLSASEFEQIGNDALQLGYLQDASKYYRKALQKNPELVSCRINIIRLFLHINKRREARYHFQQLPNITGHKLVLVKAQYLYHYRQYREARLSLDHLLFSIQLTKKEQAQTFLLAALIEWRLLTKSLHHSDWLLTPENESSTSNSIIRKLNSIEHKLKKAENTLKATPEKNYFQQYLKSSLEIYRQGIDVEKMTGGISPIFLQKLSQKISDSRLPILQKTFLHETVIRCLIRNKLWDEAYLSSNQALRIYPWMAEFYHLRAIALFQLGHIDQSLKDIFLSINNRAWNFQPVSNILSLLFDNLGQKEIYRFWEIIAFYINKLNFSVDQMVLNKYLDEKARDLLLGSSFDSNSLQKIKWQPFLDNLMQTKSPSARRLAIEVLKEQFHDGELRREVEKLQKTVKTQDVLTELSAAFVHQEKKLQKQIIKNSLLKYVIFPNDSYVIRIRKMGSRGEQLLTEILNSGSELPLFRLTAALMLTNLKTLSAYNILKQQAESNRYPDNLLASFAIHNSNLPSNLSTIIPKNDNAKQFIEKQPALYRLLFAMYGNPQLYSKEMNLLLQDKNELVVLCAAYNQRLRYCQKYKKENKKLAELFLTKIKKSRDPKIRALALRMFWTFKGQQQKYYQNYRLHWKDYGYIFDYVIKRDDDERVKFTALNIIIHSRNLGVYLKSSKRNKIVIMRLRKELKLLLKSSSSSHFIKVWSALALSRLQGYKEMWNIIQEKNTSLFIRIAGIYGCLDSDLPSQKRDWNQITKQINKLREILHKHIKQKPTTLNDRKFKQMALFTLAKMNIPWLVSSTIRPILLEESLNRENDLNVQRTALAALMWRARKDDIAALRPFLQNKDMGIRKVAAATLACLIAQHHPSEIKQFNQEVADMPLPIRHSVGVGYHSVIIHNIFDGRNALYILSYEESYRKYLNFLPQKARPFWAELLEYASEVVDGDPQYLYEAAFIYRYFKQYDKANERLIKVLNMNGLQKGKKDFRRLALMLKADIYLEQKDEENALQIFNILTEEYPLDSEISYQLSKLHQRMGHQEKSARFFWKVCLQDSPRIFKIIRRGFVTKEKAKSLQLLNLVNQKFPLTRGFILDVFPEMIDDPWVVNLPDEEK